MKIYSDNLGQFYMQFGKKMQMAAVECRAKQRNWERCKKFRYSIGKSKVEIKRLYS